MLGELWQDFQHQIKLALCQSFNDEFSIMAEEEKAPATPGALSSLKDLIMIKTRAQTSLNHSKVLKIVLECLHKHSILVELHFNVFMYRCII